MEIKKVYQTVISANNGNCMQAAYATLFGLELEQVPNFISFDDRWYEKLYEFYKTRGYRLEYTLENSMIFDVLKEASGSTVKKEDRFGEVKHYDNINGFLAASVFSPKYFNIQSKRMYLHQVLIDTDFNIVHDPNPLYKDIKKYPLANEIGYNGIVNVDFIKKLEDHE